MDHYLDFRTIIYKLEDAYNRWKVENERFNDRCLVAFPKIGKSYWAYIVMPRKKFLALFRKFPVFHECIIPGQPMRVMMDIELKQENVAPGVDVLVEGALRHEKIMARMAETLASLGSPLGPDDEPIVTVGSRKEKFSVHVTYPTKWVESPGHLLAMIENFDTMVDRSPLEKTLSGTPANFRLPFARRCEILDKEKGYEEIVGSELTYNKSTFNYIIFWRACVSSGMLIMPKEYEFVKVERPIRALASKVKMECSREKMPEALYNAAVKGAKAILAYLGVSEVKIIVNDVDKWTARVPAGELFCPHLYLTTGDRIGHDSNTSIITMSRDSNWALKVKINCMDSACDYASYERDEDFRYLYCKHF